MTFSSLTSGTLPHHNKFASRQGRGVSRVIVHHWAGTQGGDSRLVNPNADVSTNYILYSDGTLVGQVPEEYRAWTSGSWDADSPSITVEVQNSTGAPHWRVSDKAIAKLIELIADIARRYRWGSVSSSRVRGHREFAATACPGPYLWPRLGSIRSQANTRLKGGSSKPSIPVVIPEEEDDGMYKPTVHVRTQGNFEATRAHPEIGKDLKPGQKRKDGNVTIFRGYEVTTNQAVATAWARTHAKGGGRETSRTNRSGYIAIQKEAQRISLEIAG